MDATGASAPPLSAGQILLATAEQLSARQADLAPLVEEYDRLQAICEAFGELPKPSQEADDESSPAAAHVELVAYLDQVRRDLGERIRWLEPLVEEYERLLHVLPAFEAAEAISLDPGGSRRRMRRAVGAGRRPGARSAGQQARLEELRALLDQPRARTELAVRMGLSPSRVTELLEMLARDENLVKVRDPERPSRKLWALAKPGGAAPDDDGKRAAGDELPSESGAKVRTRR
jgi:hypothetical protein